MRNRINISAAIVLAIVLSNGSIVAQEQAWPGEPSANNNWLTWLDEQDAGERRLLQALDKPLTIEFEDVSWQEAVWQVAERAGVNLIVDEDVVSSSHEGPPEYITEKFDNQPAAEILDEILSPRDLNWTIANEALHIGSGYDEPLFARCYDVRKLREFGWQVHDPERMKQREQELMEASKPPAFSGNAEINIGAKSGLFGHDFSEESEFDKPSTVAELMMFYTEGPWHAIDGIGGTIDAVGDCLAVQASRRTHRQIRDLLSVLEQVVAGKSRGSSVAVVESEDEPIYAVLNKRVSVEFKDMPLVDVVQELERRAGVPIEIDSDFVIEGLVSPDDRVTINLRDVSLYSALELVFGAVGCRPFITRGKILLLDAGGCFDLQTLVVHDISDFAEDDRLPLISAMHRVTEGPWEEIDGIGGHGMLLPGGILFVSQTVRVQAEVQRLLRDIRKTRKTSVPEVKEQP